MNRSERQLAMYQFRKDVQYEPAEGEVELRLNRVVMPYQARMRQALTSQRSITISQLGQLGDQLARETQRRSSRLMICVQAIDTSMQVPLENLSFQYHQSNNFADFAFWSDIAWGINMVRAPIYLGEEHIREFGETAIQRAINEQDEYVDSNASISGTVEEYLRIQTEGKEAAKLLMSDKSGLTLIRSAVELVKHPQTPGRIERIYPPNRIQAFVTAGAELCQLAYEVMYPLTESLSP